MKNTIRISETLRRMGRIFMMSASSMMASYALIPEAERFVAYDHIYQPYFRL